MNDNRILQQFTTIFSVFMALFYLGVASYLLFFADLNYINKALRVIIGSTFLFYGLYRAYAAYKKIVEVFFTDDKDNDEE